MLVLKKANEVFSWENKWILTQVKDNTNSENAEKMAIL